MATQANNAQPTFEFPIPDQYQIPNLKNIPTSALPNFYGVVTKGPNTFLFEFDILCRSYDDTIDAHKLKLFPTTLKESTLKWFMSLGANTMTTWDVMKEKFLEKYKDYCRGNDMHEDDIFRMLQKEDESLEDYVEMFLFSFKKSNHNAFSGDFLIFLKGINDEFMDALDL